LKELAEQLQAQAQMRPIGALGMMQRLQTPPKRNEPSGSPVKTPRPLPGYRRQTVKQWQAPAAQWQAPAEPGRAPARGRSSFASSGVIEKTSAQSYAALGVLTVLAYAGWLVVLDYL
jgi:hypothetical protein